MDVSATLEELVCFSNRDGSEAMVVFPNDLNRCVIVTGDANAGEDCILANF
ncbi:MAG: hypothetical protein OXN27_23330 [Candidatus Poribacteria bacterium]|nr:hypothetical protein [Candidatus Poribacteria bacterium]